MSFDSVLQKHLRATHARVDALRSRLAASSTANEVAQSAIEELLTAMEELRVAEEELRQQNESLAAAQLMLEEENQRFVELFEYAPVPYVVTDEAGVIREANRAAADLLAVEARALRGKPLALFVERGEVRGFRARMALAAALGSPIDEWETALVPRDGEPVPVECSVQGVRARGGEPAGLRWVIRDIRARRAAEEAERRLAAESASRAEAQAAGERVRMILESITDAFVAVDREWRFTYLNRRAEELARRTVGRDEPFAGRSVWEVFPGAIAGPFHAELRRAVDTGVPVAFEAHAPLLDVWFSVRAYPAADGLSIYFSDSTERRRAEEERARLLGEAERGRAFLEAVVRQMPEGVLIGEAPDGRIAIHNPEAERLLGHPVGEDTRLADYATHGMIHPDGRPFAAEEYPLARVLLHGETLAGEEVHYRRGDGTRAVLQLRGAPVTGPGGEITAGVVTFTDATEQRRRRQADRLLATASELLASSLESAATLQRVADLVAGSLADYCIVHVEEGGELRAPGIAHHDPRRREIVRGLLRRFPVDPQGPHPAVVCLRTGEPQLIDRVTAEMMGAISTGPEHAEMLRDLGLGSAMVVPMLARGRTVGAISFGRTGASPPYTGADLEVALELSRRAALAVDNAHLYEEAQRASRAREEVLAVVSHDLRNPLNAIVLGAALLEEFSGETWSPRDRQQLRAIRNASQQMEGLIQDLVEVAALESGSSALVREPVSPRDLVGGAVELFEELAAQRSLALRAEVAPELPEVRADRARVLRILSNLLGNALKFTPPGGTVTVCAVPAEGGVRFSVADTGTGIAPQHLPHLFDRYWQARRGEKQGLGLGLAIAKGIADAHGGRIWAESEPGKGATFHFTLPAGS